MDDATPSRTLADRIARRRLAAIAGHEHDEHTAATYLDDDDPDVRATALHALARIGALTDDRLRAAVADRSPVVRLRAAELLAAHGLDGVSLLPLLDDPDPSVVEMAAWSAGERHQEEREIGGDPEAVIVERLRALSVSHDDPLVREAAVAALGSVGDPDGLPAVVRALDDRATIRRRAVIALVAFDGPEVDAAVARARNDRDWQVRQLVDELFADDVERSGDGRHERDRHQHEQDGERDGGQDAQDRHQDGHPGEAS